MATPFAPTRPTKRSRTLNQRQVLLINAGKARRQTVNGRDFLIAPMTIIVPGVLNGSRGALLYPPSEVAKEPGLWNGVPICDGHPTENGSHVSGRTPSTMASHWMGHVFNDRWDGQRRTAEGWFDVEATKRVNPAILNRLERGDSIELSTGLFTDNHDRRGVFNGKPYDAIAYNYRPDHLAILHSVRGACSREDGCGVMVNEDDARQEAAARDEAGKFAPTGGGKDKGNPKAPKSVELPKAALAGSPEAEQRVAKQNQDTSQSPEATCKCGGSCDECAAKVSPAPVAKNAFCPKTAKQTTNQRSSFMAKSKKTGREETLDWLTTNGESFGANEVRDTLDELPDDVLAEIRANAEFAAEKTLVCNTLTEMLGQGFNDAVFEAVNNGGDLKAFLASKMGPGSQPQDDDSELEPPAPAMGYGKAKNAAAGELKGEDEIGEGNGMTGNRHGNQNRAAKRQSFTELLASSGTDEDRAVWNHAIEIEREEREKLLKRITANCDRGEAKELWDEFKALPLKKLRLLANRTAPANGHAREESNGLFGVGRRIPDYGGSAGAAPTGNRRRAPDDEDVLDLPDARAILANETRA